MHSLKVNKQENVLLWVNNSCKSLKVKRDLPNIADYSIWYLQLPLKKKGEEETKKINSRYRSSYMSTLQLSRHD